VTRPEADEQLARLAAADFDFHGEATDGLTHRLHPYPAKYIPQIPRLLIDALSSPGDVVADVFCGSGTTLVEAITQGRHAIGLDANPLACHISRAKTARLSPAEWTQLASLQVEIAALRAQVTDTFTTPAWRPDGDYLQFWFHPQVVEELAAILASVRRCCYGAARTVAEVAFSAIVVAVSRQDSDTRYVRRDKQLSAGDTVGKFARSLDAAMRGLAQLRDAVPPDIFVAVHHADIVEALPLPPIDLMVCSPPYPNAYSYHLYHQTRMLWLELDQATFKQAEIGSHRKYSSKSVTGATVETFRGEVRTILERLSRRLRVNGHAVFVIGDSTVRGERIDNADLMSEVGAACGFKEVARIERSLQLTKKAFNPAHGSIRTEHVLVLRNVSDQAP
jgi:hypothetical protein